MMKDLIDYKEPKPNLLRRMLWTFINSTVFRVRLPRLFWMRNFLLKLFGAKIPWHCNIYPSVNIYAPWNLELGVYVTIGPRCNIYNRAYISIGPNSTVSQDSELCSASHDSRYSLMPLTLKPISIGKRVWIASGVFIGPGVDIGEGSVIAARSVVFKSLPDFSIAQGNPAVVTKKRLLTDSI